MSQAINAYYDEAQALYNARREAKQEEKFEIARKFVLSDLQGKKEIAATTTNSDGWPFLDGIVCC